MLSKYTAFIPFDITSFNLLDLKDDEYNKFVLKYKFFEILLQENYGKENYTNIFEPPEELYEMINNKWKEYKKTLTK